MMDVYCERTGPGLFAEPLNALSNASFLIAAWAAWYLARRLGRLSAGVQVMIWLSVSVGIGSVLWHTLATAWTLILDIVPILLFMLWFFSLYLRGVAGMPTLFAVAVVVAFLLATFLAQGYADVLNGAPVYTPGLIVVLALGIFHARQRADDRYLLLAAAGVYAVALVFRTLDSEVCPAFPIGTHFLWHTLIGLTVYLGMRCVILSRASGAGLKV